MTQAVDRWAEQARYDLDTARAMLESERYLYVLFCCQQTVEKALKAHIVKRTGEFPPRVHNLLRLAEAARVSLAPGRKQFLGDLSGYYIQTRYPEEIESIGADVTPEIAEEALRKTGEVSEWLFSMLK
jgi:HEPN domain-containing protein